MEMMYVVIVCSVLATSMLLAGAIPIDMFYAFGPANGDKALPKGFMERSGRIRLEGGIRFLGSRFYNVWVLTDGYLALDHLTNRFATEIKPFPSSGDGAIIAPYLADADTSGIGDIYYRHITDPDDLTLRAISRDINESNFEEFTGNGFKANMAIIATWYQVGYFHGHTDKNNTFQVAVATDDNSNTVAVFNYLDNGLNWYQADADYYDYEEDNPDISTVQVGFNKGGEGGIAYTLAGFTLSTNVLNLDTETNRDKPGQWTFVIDNENVVIGSSITGAGGGMRDPICGRSVRRCLRHRECTRRLRRFRDRCGHLTQDPSECTSPCMRSVTQLNSNKFGRRVWFCTAHHGIYNRLRKFYKRKCETASK